MFYNLMTFEGILCTHKKMCYEKWEILRERYSEEHSFLVCCCCVTLSRMCHVVNQHIIRGYLPSFLYIFMRGFYFNILLSCSLLLLLFRFLRDLHLISLP